MQLENERLDLKRNRDSLKFRRSRLGQYGVGFFVGFKENSLYAAERHSNLALPSLEVKKLSAQFKQLNLAELSLHAALRHIRLHLY